MNGRPKSWPCRCGTELGIIEDGELQVSTFALAVRCTRQGITWVSCPTCPARRSWSPPGVVHSLPSRCAPVRSVGTMAGRKS